MCAISLPGHGYDSSVALAKRVDIVVDYSHVCRDDRRVPLSISLKWSEMELAAGPGNWEIVEVAELDLAQGSVAATTSSVVVTARIRARSSES